MRIIFFIILLLFSTWRVYSQSFSDRTSSALISMKFLKPKIEAKANESFFNILIIKNNSNHSFSGFIKYTQPANWSIIGEKETEISILSGDSLNLPIRVSVSNTVMGEIAYSVVASLFDSNNRPILSEYCFINIPRVSDLKIRPPNKVLYFDNKTGVAKFKYKVSNRGNTNEIVQLNFNLNEYLAIDGIDLNKTYAHEYSIPAHTDTVFEIDVSLKKNIQNRDFFKLDIESYTQDSLYKKSLWINKIHSSYNHKIPQENKCAIVELTASDILNTNTPLYSLLLSGTLLLKRNTDIYYLLQKNNINSRWDNYYDTRANIGVKTKFLQLQLGTVQNIFNEYVFGLGSLLQLNYKGITLGGHYAYNDRIQQTFYGGNIFLHLKKKVNLEFGYSENLIESYRNYTKILLSGISFSIKQKHNLNVRTYLNSTSYNLASPFEKQGIAVIGNYSGKIGNFRANVRAEYGSPEYSGVSRGKVIINTNLNYKFNNSYDYLTLLYTKSDLIKSYYINDVAQPIQEFYYDDYNISYNRHVKEYLSLHAGPTIRLEKFNIPYIDTNPKQYFKTMTPGMLLSLRYNNTVSQFYFRPKLEIGQVNTISERYSTKPYINYNLDLNTTYKEFGLYAQYRNGPSGIYGKYLYSDVGYFTRWLVFMPSYTKDLFKNTMNVDLRANYRYDINTKNKYISFSAQLLFYLPKSWTLRLLNSFTSYSKFDALNNASIRYNSAYFEAAIKKEFNCKQPRFQYHDLKIVFFKDLNGNRKKEPNEPGLRNVLAAIEQDQEVVEYEMNKDFISQKLLTGADGNINYTNIVNGAYKVKYVLIGDMVGNFNREEMTYPFTIEEDKTIYIPYLENNRIVGQVILNRDPLSSLEQNIDISNIRVVAEDTQGHSYSALTDKQGKFILYTPVTDHYVVKINNIFYESFDLQQPEFIVKFNGYKQFEVTFVFDEKKKKINFDNELAVEDLKLDDIKVIRKTTLTGKVRDAISLEPVESEIKIIDNKTNKVVSRAISNKNNGNYNISYAAGTHFRIEVVAKGYWEHVENLYIEQVISIQNINKDIMLNKEGANREEEQKTFIIYNKTEDEFVDNFKQGQQIPINYLNFKFKETRLDPKAKPELDRLIELLNKNKTVSVEIAGYSDDNGNARVEKMMALRRAKEVEKYLIAHGLSQDRINVKSYGNTRPLVPGSSEKAKAKNRRVEIIVR